MAQFSNWFQYVSDAGSCVRRAGPVVIDQLEYAHLTEHQQLAYVMGKVWNNMHRPSKPNTPYWDYVEDGYTFSNIEYTDNEVTWDAYTVRQSEYRMGITGPFQQSGPW